MGVEALKNKFGSGAERRWFILGLHIQAVDQVEQALNFAKLRQSFSRSGIRRDFQFAAHLKPLHHGLHVGVAEEFGENFAHGGADQIFRNIFRATQFAFVLQFEFSCHCGDGGIHVGNFGDGKMLAVADGTLLGAAQYIFKPADGQALADAGAAIDALVITGVKRDFFDDLTEIFRSFEPAISVASGPRFLRSERRRVELNKTSGFERLYHRVTTLYFGGIAQHLASLRPILRPGAFLGYVVGDQASYLRVMIRTGQLIAQIADSLGYKVESIDLFRTRIATATGEQLREEVVVLRWPGKK